jgi:hypothetical protein
MAETMDDLTARQKQWFASVRANLEARTGRTLEAWVKIARGCPLEGKRERQAWLKAEHGLGQNHAMYVLGEAFPPDGPTWREPDALREALWSDPAARAILEAVEAAVAELPDLVRGQRKGFTAFSRRVQFAAVKPAKGGAALLGLAVAVEANPRLVAATGREGWSERLKAVVRLEGPGEVDAEIAGLLRRAWEGA